MKPTKNKVYCPDCHRTKMLFSSEEKALNFMRFNSDEIMEVSDKAPIRAYYCDSCSGWHLTSLENYTYLGPTTADRALWDAKKRENYGFLLQAQTFIKAIEDLIEKGILDDARTECKRFLNFCEVNAVKLNMFPQSTDLMERFTHCVQACALSKTIGVKLEALLEEAEAIAEEVVDKNLLIGRFDCLRSLYNIFMKEPNADPAKIENFQERIQRLILLCQDEIASNKIKDKLLVLTKRHKAAEEAFENKNWITAKRLYQGTKTYKATLDKSGIPTPEMPDLDEKITICTLYAGIVSIKSKLDAAERMLAAGSDPTVRYFIDTAQQDLFKICEIEGENEKKLELLDQLEAVRKLYLSN